MADEKEIDLVVRMVGDRRGGQHAVMLWLMEQFDGCYFSRQNFKKQRWNALQKSRFPSLRRFKNRYKGNRTGIFVVYEDKNLHFIRGEAVPEFGKKVYDIIILRDPYNLFASIVKVNLREIYKKRNLQKRLLSWKSKAKSVLEEGDFYFIDFNKWHISLLYRKKIISWFPEFTFTDAMRQRVQQRFLSSFDKIEYDGKADQMPLLGRYEDESLKNSEVMKCVWNDDEVKNLSIRVFGEEMMEPIIHGMTEIYG